MTDFNLANNIIKAINRGFSSNINPNSINSKPADSLENKAPTLQNSEQTLSNSPYLGNKNLYNLPFDKQLLISTVEIQQRADYIKNLLNLPKDFESFINLIKTNGAILFASKDLNGLLLNDKINLKILTRLLSENAKQAAQDVIMTISEITKTGSNNVNQLKELLNLFAGANAQIDSAQTLKNMFLLYLPFLPLSLRNDMNLDFNIEIKNEEENNGAKEESIEVMIQTINFGNVLLILQSAKNDEINVFITASTNFPKEEVLKLFFGESKRLDIKSKLSIELNGVKSEKTNKETNVKLISKDFVSPKLIQAAYTMIKIVIDVDIEKKIINETNEG